MIYLCVFIVCLWTVFQYDIKKKIGYRKVFYILLFLLAIGIAGCRFVVGGDTVRYIRHFENYPLLQDIDLFSYVLYDPFWLLLNSIIKTIWDNFIFFQFVHAILVNVVFFYLAKSYSNYRYTVILFYFIYLYIYYNMEILREVLAINLFLLALPSYEKKKWVRYYLYTLGGFMFHSSAIITLLLPLFRNINLSIFKICVLIVSSSLVFGYFSDLLDFFLLNPAMVQRFETYKDMSLNFNAKLLHILSFVILPIIIIHINDRKINNGKPFWQILYMPYFFIASLSVGNTAIGNRFMNYMIPILLFYYVDFIYAAYQSIYMRKVRSLFFIIVICIPLMIEFRGYFKDTSYALPGSKNYFRWYPFTNIFEIEDSQQQQIVYEREKYVDALMFESLK